jgi:hypothetical protein
MESAPPPPQRVSRIAMNDQKGKELQMRYITNRLIAVVLGLVITAPLYGAGPDEQVALRAVANIARMAIGTHCVDPDTTSWTFGPPPPDYFNGGTPNQKILVRVWHYGWALRTRSADLSNIRSTLLDFVNRQQQVTASDGPLGHYATTLGANEELTSSHYQLWSGAMAAAYLYALADGGTLNTDSERLTRETQIRDAVRRWWSDEKALYDRVYTNDRLDAPGARFATNFATSGASITNALRDDVYRLLRGLTPAIFRSCSSDRQVASSFVMQELAARGVPPLGQPPANYTPGPKLYDTLCVYRMGSDWTLYFPAMRNVTGALYWVEFRNNMIRRATVPYNGVKPSPYPAGLASRDSIPGVVAGAATCPQPEALNQ